MYTNQQAFPPPRQQQQQQQPQVQHLPQGQAPIEPQALRLQGNGFLQQKVPGHPRNGPPPAVQKGFTNSSILLHNLNNGHPPPNLPGTGGAAPDHGQATTPPFGNGLSDSGFGDHSSSLSVQQQQQQQQQPPGQLPFSADTRLLKTADDDKVFTWILELTHGTNAAREQALLELGKKREQYEDLALILWHSFGVMTSLVQEIISVYPVLSPPQLTSSASNRVCNALALLQCVASHNDTRLLFLHAHIPLFLYPFLNTTSKSRSFEYLRLTSLGVIGALVKNDSSHVINFLLSTEIIPLCLRIMESGTELSKTVAIFIVQKILMDDMGLSYVCQTYERFFAVSTVLSNMVTQLVEVPTSRLLKHVVRCYLRLSDNPRAREALRQILPEPLRDATFSQTLRDDVGTKRCLAQLLANLSDNYE